MDTYVYAHEREAFRKELQPKLDKLGLRASIYEDGGIAISRPNSSCVLLFADECHMREGIGKIMANVKKLLRN